MKRLFFEKAYWPFLVTAIVTLCFSIFYWGAYPGSLFDISLYDVLFEVSTSRMWLLFTGYLSILSLIYFITEKKRLKLRKWLVVSHYIFILLFLIFFIFFSGFESPLGKDITKNIPLLTLVGIYGLVFILDIVFFVVGIILLIANLIVANKN